MGIKLGNFIKDTNNVFTQEEAEMIYLASGYVDGVCISNDEHYPPTIYFDKGETAKKYWMMRIMSDNEMLEEIKSRVWKEHCTYAVGDDSSREGYRYILSDEDYHLLMEQAERVKELENKNKRYREALKNIYELAEYNEYDNILEQIVSEIEKVLE